MAILILGFRWPGRPLERPTQVVDDMSSPTSGASTSYRNVTVLMLRFPRSELAGDVRPEMGG